jgi:hypothetical protein
LHVVVGGLAAQRDLDLDGAIAGDLEEARLVAGFGQQDVAVVEQHSGVHFSLRAFVFPDDLLIAGHFNDGAAGVGLGLGEGEQ